MTVMNVRVVEAYASAARTATPTPVAIGSDGRAMAHVVVVATAAAATPSVVPAIEAYDPVSATWYPLLTGAAITGTGTTVLKLGPGLTAVPNVCAADFLPGQFRVSMTHADADSITYSVGVHMGG